MQIADDTTTFPMQKRAQKIRKRIHKRRRKLAQACSLCSCATNILLNIGFGARHHFRNGKVVHIWIIYYVWLCCSCTYWMPDMHICTWMHRLECWWKYAMLFAIFQANNYEALMLVICAAVWWLCSIYATSIVHYSCYSQTGYVWIQGNLLENVNRFRLTHTRITET